MAALGLHRRINRAAVLALRDIQSRSMGNLCAVLRLCVFVGARDSDVLDKAMSFRHSQKTKDLLRKLRTIHGKRNTKIYRAWTAMKARCDLPSVESYPSYGGRGITYCKRWGKFQNFLADMGEPESGLSLDRIDVNGNYEPSNCRWIPMAEQCHNTQRSRLVTIGDLKITIANAARKFNIRPNTIKWRLDRGWPDDVAVLTIPRWNTRPKK